MENADQAKHTKNKRKNQSFESQFRFKLDTCSKNKDLSGAISLYENAISQNFRLNQYLFNTLLYLCSNSLSDDFLSSSKETSDLSSDSALAYGFRVFDHMLASNVNPTEATITAMSRLAVGKGDTDLAFELVKTMGKYNISPRLRTYDSALFAYCSKSEVEKAYSVEEHMVSMGISPEESQLSALLKVSVDSGREDKVYSYLQKLRSSVRFVSTSIAEVIERWFCSSLASEVGMLNWDEDNVKDVILKNGGGWHGQGWLGKGKWFFCKSNINSDGSCCSCGEKLVCVDIDEVETEKFAESVASLAMEREVKSNFRNFQEWLKKHGQYEAIVDGANVALYKQNFADGEFSLSQIDAVLKNLYQRGERKLPLVILHNKRFRALLENPSNKKLLEDWKAQGALYTTPNGSNDDWYWLYAAVTLRCLLVTNDEMRDHIFALLGSSFFLKWKERHQVRYTFVKCNLKLHMPPSYSVVIQESEKGSWHVPIEGDCNDEASRTWLCITRPKSCEHSDELLLNLEVPETERLKYNQTKSNSYKLEDVTTEKGRESGPISFQLSNSNTVSITGKRKDRSPSSEPHS
ncbi:proteinaceous RNase P 2-like [Telopea speciosissima]|uniref:proteinaceous RNase P 2-like n=1 Tax=Telopea speciosissima TaxID=54955 RepID=UPI001CC79FC3|nr:proteinaceous RNase P 2-like [Telopea speciosissima]